MRVGPVLEGPVTEGRVEVEAAVEVVGQEGKSLLGPQRATVK